MSKSGWVIAMNPPERSAEAEEAAKARLHQQMDAIPDAADQETKIQLMGEAIRE